MYVSRREREQGRETDLRGVQVHVFNGGGREEDREIYIYYIRNQIKYILHKIYQMNVTETLCVYVCKRERET